MADATSTGACHPPVSDAAPVDQGILIEMNDNNDICINATHLTVKCDNTFLMQGSSNGKKVSASSRGSAVAGKSSVIVVQNTTEQTSSTRRLPDIRTCAKNTAAVGALLVATKIAGRIVSWHWVRNRTERALSKRSAPLLTHLLSHSNPRTTRAAVNHIALDIQHASNTRLAAPATAEFPSLPDAELSRMTAAHTRQCAAATAPQRPSTAAPFEAVALSHKCTRPASTLSVVSDETIGSSDGSEGSVSCTPHRTMSPVGGIIQDPCTQAVSPPALEGPAAVSASAAQCTPSAIPQSGTTADAAVAPSPPTSTAASCKCAEGGREETVLPVCRPCPWPEGTPEEGRATHMLSNDSALWDTFITTLHRMLRSRDLGQQHDAAFAVQVVAFACERLAQRLIDEGIVRVLIACVPDTFGARVRRGGARLRQPGTPQTRGLPSPNSLLAISPIYLPSVHMDIKHRAVTLTPRGVNYAFLSMIPALGRRLQRQLVPRCRATAAKRSVALEALQNITSLRTGAKAFLAHDGSLDALCTASYTASLLGRLAAVEIAHSCMINFPRSRTRLHHVGFDQALANALDSTRSSVMREACMRAWMRLQPDRELLSSDMGHASMYS